jgi:hypothetical protein
MKRMIGTWVAGIAILGSAAVLTVAQGVAQGFPQNDGAPKCSVATLKGRYMFAAPAIIFPPAFGLTEQAVGNAAGFHVFNGDGKGQDYVTFTLNGVDQHVPSPAPFKYTLEENCTGTYTLQPPGIGLPAFNIFVSPNGSEMTSINTEGSSAASYTPSRRVWPQ